MAFYDEMKRKLNQTKETVIQKTSNYTELSRLESSNAELEKMIASVYREMGREYYGKYAANPQGVDPELLHYFYTINENLEKIEKNRVEIRKLKGLKQCPGCGAEISFDAAFCNHCGRKQILKAAVDDAEVICPKCGSRCEGGQLFCMVCGAKLDSEKKAARRICKKCGTFLQEGSGFCMVCGTKWEGDKPEPGFGSSPEQPESGAEAVPEEEKKDCPEKNGLEEV